nr:uncharacterized protein LOC111997656 [Quercus suber]
MPVWSPRSTSYPLSEEQLKGLLKRYDTNGDGKLSKNELKAAFRSLGLHFSGWRAGQALRHADANGDGYVSEDEMKELVKQITVVEDGFAFPEGSPIPEGIPLAGSSSSHKAAETEEGSSEKGEEVVELSSSEEEFSVFDQVEQPEDPPGDLGDPHLSETDLQPPRFGTQTEMGLKRQPQTSLLDLLEGKSEKSAIQAIFRLDEEVDGQSNALVQERDKFLKAASTLKRSEADIKKAIGSLEEMTKDRDRAAFDLAAATKQAENQTKRLQDVEGQLQAAKEDVADLKKKLAEAVGAKGIAEYARDEAVRAKEEAVFARIHAERSLEQAEEEAFAEGVAKTEAIFKAQIPEESVLPMASESQTKTAKGTSSADRPFEEAEPHGALEGTGTDGQEVPQGGVRPPADFRATLTVPQISPTVEGSSELAPPD